MQSKIWAVLLVALLFACSREPITMQAKRLGTEQFSKSAWAQADQLQRGSMVYSFLAQHPVESLTTTRVQTLLGKPTGYFDHDENPAYFVGPSSVDSLYGKGYLLAFITNKKSGQVVDIKLLPEPK